MIPALTIAGVLPPYIGATQTLAGVAPYVASMSEVAQMFCTNEQRVKLFLGLTDYRKALVAAGITTGAQWINGSFCEDVERNRGRPPGDIDLVTLYVRPAHLTADGDWRSFVQANLNLFDPKLIKPAFHCHAFSIDVGYPAALVLRQITYWFGLFSHQRVTYLWKGLVQVPLVSDDADAIKVAKGRGAGP